MTPEQIIVAVIDRKFDAAMPGWWPDTEEWAAESVAALRAAGLLPGPDDIVVSREDVWTALAQIEDSNPVIPNHFAGTYERLRAALSQPHPEETP